MRAPAMRALFIIFVALFSSAQAGDPVVEVEVATADGEIAKQGDGGATAAAATETRAKTETISAAAVAPSSSSSKPEPDPEAAGLALLDRELVELELTISLQQKKLALLSALRRQFLNGSRTIPTGLLAALDGATSERLLELGDELLPSARASPARAARGEPPASRRRASIDERDVVPKQISDFLLTRVQLSLEAPAVIELSEVLSFRMRGVPSRSKKNKKTAGAAYVNLLAVVDSTGLVKIYDSNSELVTEFESGHADVCAIAFDGQDDPILATSSRDGSMHVHNMTLWRDETIIAGKRPRLPPPEKVVGEDGEERVGPRPKPIPPETKTSAGIGLIVQLESIADVPKLDAPAMIYSAGDLSSANLSVDASITTMHIYNWRGQGKFVVAGDDAGALRLYARNGTLHKVLQHEHPIVALRRGGTSTFAVSSGNGVNFLSASRFELTSMFCKGTLSPVVSLAYDVLSPGMLYAGLASGEVLAFNTKAKNDNRITCRLSNKLPLSPHAGPVSVATVGRWWLVLFCGRGARETEEGTTSLVKVVAPVDEKTIDREMRALRDMGACSFLNELFARLLSWRLSAHRCAGTPSRPHRRTSRCTIARTSTARVRALSRAWSSRTRWVSARVRMGPSLRYRLALVASRCQSPIRRACQAPRFSCRSRARRT